MKSKAAVRRIVEALKTLYPDAMCSLQYQKDYELLFRRAALRPVHRRACEHGHPRAVRKVPDA